MNSGLILFNKPPGITSFDALRDIKRSLGTGKVGHTGTLDKFASGLLIVLVGRALRLSRWFTHCDKKYRAKIHFGEETDTLDPEGEIIAKAPLPSREDAERTLKQFTGSVMQAPPAFSAIHVNGKRASNLARSGNAPEMKKRPVTIYELELLSWEPPFADIFVHCSSGTYIRSLARDIAIAAGSRAHLCELKRTHVGGFCIEEKKHEEEKDYSIMAINKTVINFIGMPWFEVNTNEKREILQGKPLDRILKIKTLDSSVENSSLNQAAAVFEGEELIAIIEKNGLNAALNWKYACVLG